MFQAMTRLFLWLSLTLMTLLSGCGGHENKKGVRVAAPGAPYAVVIEKTDLGACCSSRIVGRLDGFNGEHDPIFELKGVNDVSLERAGPHNLIVKTCDATDVRYRSGLWNDNASAQVFVDLTNMRGKKVRDEIICDLGNKVRF